MAEGFESPGVWGPVRVVWGLGFWGRGLGSSEVGLGVRQFRI